MENKVKMKAMLKQMQSVIALVIIFVVASVVCVKDGKNNFLDLRNLMNVLRAVSENGIIAIGMTMILILGDIDLSVGSVVGLISTGCVSDGKERTWIRTGSSFESCNRRSVRTFQRSLYYQTETAGIYRNTCFHEHCPRSCKILGKWNRYPTGIRRRRGNGSAGI